MQDICNQTHYVDYKVIGVTRFHSRNTSKFIISLFLYVGWKRVVTNSATFYCHKQLCSGARIQD